MRMPTLALLLTLTAIGIDPDTAAAFADLKTQPQGYYAYATVSTEATAGGKQRLAETLSFVVCGFSRTNNLKHQIPVHVPGTDLYRLDLSGLQWEKHWVGILQRHYVPVYRQDLLGTKHYPLVVRADWIVGELTDPTFTKESSELLLFGKAIKTGTEFKQVLKVNSAAKHAFGYLEGASGVQTQGMARLMENRDTAQRTQFFETLDSIIVAGKSDPIENPIPGTLRHDGKEMIGAVQKYWGDEYGIVQVYKLATGNSDPKNLDKSVDKAPPELVKDREGLRGGDIRDKLDCINCHRNGALYPTLDGYRQYILSGAKIYSDKATKEEIERFYESPFIKQLEQQEKDFREGVRLINGLSSERNGEQFKQCILKYDADVDLAQAAREVYSTPEELRLAIGGYAPTGKLTGRLSLLAQGTPISRDQWKANIAQVQCIILPAWRNKK